MRQAIRLYQHEREALDEQYRCSECTLRFNMEKTVAGPRCCPGCSAIYDVTTEQLAEQLARCAVALNTTPTTLLWTLRIMLGFYR